MDATGWVNMSLISRQLIQQVLPQLVGPMIIMGDPAWNGTIGFILCTSMLNGPHASDGLGWE